MIAHIISIGNELTGGQTVDSNSAWLARQLATLGIQCTRHITISDDLEPIRDALIDASRHADLVLVTGGLGPTPDDLTREALAEAMNRPLMLHPPSLAHIEAYFQARHRTMHEANRRQAMIPEGAEAIENEFGTAPGLRARLNQADVHIMPGVPHEMREMFERRIRPRLAASGAGVTLERVLRTFGMSESEIGERIKDLMRRDRNPTVGTSAAEMIISIRIVAQAATRERCAEMLDADALDIRDRLGIAVFGEADDTLATAVAALLSRRRLTIATAESCTGGMIAARLTDIPGSSDYFKQGFVTYSNESKSRLLGVPPELIVAQGAVSRAIAESMALNGRRLAETDVAVGVTGIAGPSGGTPAKPVGLVYVALATRDRVLVKELRLGENLTRDQVRDRTTKAVLNWLRLTLLGVEK